MAISPHQQPETDGVHESLATLVAFMGTTDDAIVAAAARREVPRLVGVIEVLLEDHQPGCDTLCAACRPKRGLRWKRRCLPCRVYLAVQLHLDGAATLSRHYTTSTA
ncbi:hypothetical protein [Kutzneria sp. NPDC052558]|uniref:hypothetical protein n=1 Tax=Kutzneria sp. NPDC052558 TaxID=3364121 RepID=UPI0037C51DF2